MKMLSRAGAGLMICLWTAGLFAEVAAQQVLNVEPQCDIPLAAPVAASSTADAEACKNACVAEAKCQSFVFISGWNKCFLKGKAKRRVSLRAYAGVRDAEPSVDHDHTGKDLRRESGVKTAKDCQASCTKEPLCQGYSYFLGYGDCWLKAKSGRLIGKVFYCGQKS